MWHVPDPWHKLAHLYSPCKNSLCTRYEQLRIIIQLRLSLLISKSFTKYSESIGILFLCVLFKYSNMRWFYTSPFVSMRVFVNCRQMDHFNVRSIEYRIFSVSWHRCKKFRNLLWFFVISCTNISAAAILVKCHHETLKKW